MGLEEHALKRRRVVQAVVKNPSPKFLKGLELKATNKGAGRMLPCFDAAHLDTAHTAAPVPRQGTRPVAPTGKDGQNREAPFDLEGDARQRSDVRRQRGGFRLDVRWCTGAAVHHPEAVHDAMNNFPAMAPRGFDALNHHLTGPCADRFVGFNPAKTCVPVACVSEARDEEPLQGLLTPVCLVARSRALPLQLMATPNQGGDHPPKHAMALGTGVEGEPWDAEANGRWP